MDRAAFTHVAATEATHWWFVGRRAVIDALLDGIRLPDSGSILEAGCGTGGNLATLSQRGHITAFEPPLDALSFARGRHPDVDIRQGSLPSELPYAPHAAQRELEFSTKDVVDVECAARKRC